MNIIQKIRSVINAAVWSFLGVVLTVVFYYVAQYRNPFDFRIRVSDDVNLVEVKERIADLEIRYKGEDLLNSQKEIRLVSIILDNRGQTVLQQYYDTGEPFGLRFEDAVVLDVSVSDANSQYLAEHILPQRIPQKRDGASPDGNEAARGTDPFARGEVHLAKLIFEKGKSVTLKMYILRQKGQQETSIASLGKIANVDLIPVTREIRGTPQTSQEPSPIVILYILLGYVAVVVTTFSIMLLANAAERRGRKKRVAHFLARHPHLSAAERRIVEIYQDGGADRFSDQLRMVVETGSLDFLAYIQKELSFGHRSPFRRVLLMFRRLPRMQRLDPSRLPKELFQIHGSDVRLRDQERAFIIEFFSAMGVLSGRTTNEEPPIATADHSEETPAEGAQQGAVPNGGSATAVDNTNTPGGPPSMS